MAVDALAALSLGLVTSGAGGGGGSFAVTTTLIVADAGGGTATITVSGATVGRTVRAYYQYRTAQAGPTGWIAAGIATVGAGGQASISVTPATGYGYYTWVVAQFDSAGLLVENLSQTYFRPLVDPTARSVWERCAVAVKDVIDGLNLSGIDTSHSLVEWWPKILRGMSPAPPCVLVAPFSAEDYPNTGVNDQDDVGYPVLVVLVDKLNNDSAANMTRDLLWREKVSRVFRFQRLAGVPEVYNSDIRPDVVVHPDAYANGLLVSSILLRFISRESRGQ